MAGIDEVGRGPLAGPVVAAAVVLPELKGKRVRHLSMIKDSKALGPKQREVAGVLVRRIAVSVGIGGVAAGEIDAMGIAPATRLAMRRALEQLPERPIICWWMPCRYHGTAFPAPPSSEATGCVLPSPPLLSWRRSTGMRLWLKWTPSTLATALRCTKDMLPGRTFRRWPG